MIIDGNYFCECCAQHFLTENNLRQHESGKYHRRVALRWWKKHGRDCYTGDKRWYRGGEKEEASAVRRLLSGPAVTVPKLREGWARQKMGGE